MNMLPIYGTIPTEITCKRVLKKPKSQKEAKLMALIYGDDSFKVSIFPPQPLDFKIPEYKPFHHEVTPMTMGEFVNKLQSVPHDSLLVILNYNRFSKIFNVEPMEIPSMIDYREDENEIVLYSVYFGDGKMIECTILNSIIAFDQDQKVSIMKQKKYGRAMVPDDAPLYLYSKSEGKQVITDVVTFRGAAMMSERNYLGIVIEDDIFIPDLDDVE